MKVTSKTMRTTPPNRVSALKRLSNPKPINNNNDIRNRLSASTTPVVTDARQLLANRSKPVFDARQLLSRQSSKNLIQNNIVQTEEDEEEDDEEMITTSGFNGRLTSGNSGLSFGNKKNPFIKDGPNSVEPISFTKTITNKSARREDDDYHYHTAHTQSALSDQKVVISFVNDDYENESKSPSPPPIIRRLHDASMQTAHPSSSSRSPIRMSSHRRHTDEPSLKRKAPTTDRPQDIPSTSSKGSVKRTSTGAPVSTRLTSNTSTIPKPTHSESATILITNLHSSVTEEDVMELFNQIGRITEIITLSRGCVQLTYSKQEYAEQAVAKYHNRLLDGQHMYVSLQQPSSYTTKSSRNSSSSNRISDSSLSTNNNNNNESGKGNSNKIIIDPTFIRQALFNPSNNTTNPVQFQVKL